MRRALFVLTNATGLAEVPASTGFDVRETADVWHALTAADTQIEFSSPTGGPCRPIVPEHPSSAVRAFMDGPTWDWATARSLRLADVDPTEFNLLYLVGGHGAMIDFWPSADVHAAVVETLGAGRCVAAICHGVAGLLSPSPGDSPVVAGRAITAFSDAEEEARGLFGVVPYSLEQQLIGQGATYTAGPDRTSHVVVDQQLITAQNPYSTHEFSQRILQRIAAGEERK